ETATGELLAERERTARLSERQSLARQIHDSALQILALIHKRGRELAGQERVSGRQVAELADMAGRQEAELRALVLRPTERSASGTASLRDALERTARGIDGVPVTVNAIGALILPAALVSEVAAAVGEALRNAARHAGAHRVVVFAEQADGRLALSVRDDGCGFTYDEAELAEQGKAGMLRSMKGRIVDLGGTMDVETAPGRGTEVTFAIHVED
ncbi:MAG: ATP-binding protein, partial [Egibacteraceae bacterium]